VAFTTPEGLFEPTMMFFRLMNSPATFQTMINEILWNLINTGNIDDVIVGTELEEGYDKIVEEVVKRLADNDLYVKPEKCKWKMKKVGFLGVVIVLERIKMEEEKVKDILDWPTLQRVKNIQKFLGLANYYHQFIKDFVAIARLLYDMVKKDQK